MENDKEKKIGNPVLDVIVRLVMVYAAATCFFNGLQNWRNEVYLESGIWFLLSLSQIGLFWGFHKSKVVRLITWVPLTLALILLVLSRLF